MPEIEARPWAKNRHGGAPKGARPSAEGRKAPRKRLACRVVSAFTRVFDALWHAAGARWHPGACRRSAHPSWGRDEGHTPGADAPRERDRLFDIVRRECGELL